MSEAVTHMGELCLNIFETISQLKGAQLWLSCAAQRHNFPASVSVKMNARSVSGRVKRFVVPVLFTVAVLKNATAAV
jgi:hypothetical protein